MPGVVMICCGERSGQSGCFRASGTAGPINAQFYWQPTSPHHLFGIKIRRPFPSAYRRPHITVVPRGEILNFSCKNYQVWPP